MSKWNGGGIPFGYQFNQDTKSLEVNKKEAETLKIIFGLAAKGQGVSTICNELNNKKKPTRHARKWSITMLAGILSYSRLNFYRGIDPNGLQGNWERLLSENIYSKIILYKKEDSNADKLDYSQRANYLLTGIDKLKCGYCGGAVKAVTVKKPNGNVFYYYLCTNKQTGGTSVCPNSKVVTMSIVDDLVLTDLKVQITKKDEINKFIELKKSELQSEIKIQVNAISSALLNEKNNIKLNDILIRGKDIVSELTNQINSLVPPTAFSGRSKQASIIANIKEIKVFIDRIEIEYLYPIDTSLRFTKIIDIEK